MFVRLAQDVEDKKLTTGFSTVRRPLLSADGTGLSLSDLRTTPGEKIDLWYRNHCEANYLVEGSAEVLDKATGENHRLVPGDPVCRWPQRSPSCEQHQRRAFP